MRSEPSALDNSNTDRSVGTAPSRPTSSPRCLLPRNDRRQTAKIAVRNVGRSLDSSCSSLVSALHTLGFSMHIELSSSWLRLSRNIRGIQEGILEKSSCQF
ncbi:unnamed protein product [Victoria cruziana]